MSNISLLSLYLFVCGQLGAEGAQPTIQAAIKANTAYRERLLAGCRFNVSVTGTQKKSGGLKTLSSRKNRISFAPLRWIRESEPGHGNEPWIMEVHGFNDRYGFRLQNHQKKAPLWLVADLKINDPLHMLLQGRAKQLRQLTPGELVTHGILPFLEVEGIPCERLLGHPSFKVKKIENMGNRVRIEFESDVESFSGPDRLLCGNLWLLPESSWVIDEYHVTILPLSKTESPVKMKMEWRQLGDMPEPVRARISYSPKEGPISWEYQYSDWMLVGEPPERFTLSHYGLPEPISAQQQIQWYLWTALAGILCLGLAALFRWKIRRSKRIAELP